MVEWILVLVGVACGALGYGLGYWLGWRESRIPLFDTCANRLYTLSLIEEHYASSGSYEPSGESCRARAGVYPDVLHA